MDRPCVEMNWQKRRPVCSLQTNKDKKKKQRKQKKKIGQRGRMKEWAILCSQTDGGREKRKETKINEGTVDIE